MDGFRFQSKYESRVHLLERYAQFIIGHPGFEMRVIGINLQFVQDAELFMHRVEVAAQAVRYKVLQQSGSMMVLFLLLGSVGCIVKPQKRITQGHLPDTCTL